MKIEHIETRHIQIPLVKPFKTALRTATHTDSLYATVTFDNGIQGYGEAAATVMITGDSIASMKYIIDEIIFPKVKGMDPIKDYGLVMETIQNACAKNTSAKAAVDIAVHDAIAKYYEAPLYQYLGAHRHEFQTDYTVSVNEPEEMVQDLNELLENGHRIFKIKLGKGSVEDDIIRMVNLYHTAIQKPEVVYRIDANQAWSVAESKMFITEMKTSGVPIQFIEQPVKAYDVEGLKEVTNFSHIPIMADESIYNLYDAKQILHHRYADLINIKLMKSGGIYPARKIAAICEAYGVNCMVGSMIETSLSVQAACHFAASTKNVVYYDLDSYFMVEPQFRQQGVAVSEPNIFKLTDKKGIGVEL